MHKKACLFTILNMKKNTKKSGNTYPKKEERDASHQEIANVFGLTRMRIGQIEKGIKEKLQHNPVLRELWLNDT